MRPSFPPSLRVRLDESSPDLLQELLTPKLDAKQQEEMDRSRSLSVVKAEREAHEKCVPLFTPRADDAILHILCWELLTPKAKCKAAGGWTACTPSSSSRLSARHTRSETQPPFCIRCECRR